MLLMVWHRTTHRTVGGKQDAKSEMADKE